MAFDRQFGRGDIRPPEEHGEDPGEERDELLLDPAPAWDAVSANVATRLHLRQPQAFVRARLGPHRPRHPLGEISIH